MRSFNAQTFIDDVRAHNGKAKENLRWFIHAYCWAAKHLRQIHVAAPDFTLGWLQQMIAESYGFDVESLIRTCTRIADSNTQEGLDKGLDIVERIGIWQCITAQRKITEDKFLATVRRKNITAEQFQRSVSKIVEEDAQARKEALRVRVEKLYSQRNAFKQSTAPANKETGITASKDDEIARLKKLLAEKEAEIKRLRAALAAVAEATKVAC